MQLKGRAYVQQAQGPNLIPISPIKKRKKLLRGDVAFNTRLAVGCVNPAGFPENGLSHVLQGL